MIYNSMKSKSYVLSDLIVYKGDNSKCGIIDNVLLLCYNIIFFL